MDCIPISKVWHLGRLEHTASVHALIDTGVQNERVHTMICIEASYFALTLTVRTHTLICIEAPQFALTLTVRTHTLICIGAPIKRRVDASGRAFAAAAKAVVTKASR